MKNLDHLVSAARKSTPTWDDARATRILSSTLATREQRATRDRFLRRAMVVGGAAALLGFIFLRGASASSDPSAINVATTLGDAGYACD